MNIHWKDWCWSWNSNTLATWCEELTHWKRPWCWKRLKAGGEGDDREWDGWMASLTRWTWVWASFGNWWRTGKPGVLQSMGSQKVRHNWVTELNWTESHVAKQSSWVPLPSCSSPMFPFPIKSLALSARVSPQTIYFEGLDKSPLLGPGRDLPSCNNLFIWIIWYVAFSG